MIRLTDGTQIVRAIDGNYVVYNNTIDLEVKINYSGYKSVLRAIGDNVRNKNEVLEELENSGFIYDDKRCTTGEYKYPLNSVTIEIDRSCNLNCVHCYGSYGQRKDTARVEYDWFISNIPYLKKLNTMSIGLTGGECTNHPDFLKICSCILENDFKLVVLTNGYNKKIIEKLLETTKNYNYIIKVSLDGLEKTHNYIRGVKNAFEKTVETLRIIQQYKNIQLYISTTVMKSNLHEISTIKEYVLKEFPEATHTFDLIYPEYTKENSCRARESITIEELVDISDRYPFLLKKGTKEDDYLHRCTGGVSQCAVLADGKVVICIGAQDDRFAFKHNVFEHDIEYVWKNCGKNIDRFRKEKCYATRNCKKCNMRKECTSRDCRLLAFEYTGNEANSNPVGCFITRHEGACS